MHGKLWEVVNWPCYLWSLQQNLSSVCMATWINPWPKPNGHAAAAAPPTRKHTDASQVLRAAPAGLCWAGKVASLTGANASQLCWIFMQMHPTSPPKLQGALELLPSSQGLSARHRPAPRATGEGSNRQSSPDNPDITHYKTPRDAEKFPKALLL